MTAYQLLPPLAPDERLALRADIAANGIRVPIDVDEDGNVLDGHHRALIGAELGIDVPRRVIPGLSEDEKRAHALAVNIHRRNLSREQRRDLIGSLREQGLPVRAIAQATGLPKSTVADDLSQLSGSGQFSQPERIVGADGKSRPAARPITTVEPAPPVITQEDHEFWAEAAKRMTADGTVARWNAERPNLDAMLGLSEAAELITDTEIEPEVLAGQIPSVSQHHIPGIEAAYEWLGRFLTVARQETVT